MKFSILTAAKKSDDFASRVNPKGGAPPPMPEKTKIHLKNDNSLGQKRSNRNRQDQPLPALPSTEPNRYVLGILM